jgi:hypothetical protein
MARPTAQTLSSSAVRAKVRRWKSVQQVILSHGDASFLLDWRSRRKAHRRLASVRDVPRCGYIPGQDTPGRPPFMQMAHLHYAT